MRSVDAVIVGAEAVAESGGIIAKVSPPPPPATHFLASFHFSPSLLVNCCTAGTLSNRYDRQVFECFCVCCVRELQVLKDIPINPSRPSERPCNNNSSCSIYRGSLFVGHNRRSQRSWNQGHCHPPFFFLCFLRKSRHNHIFFACSQMSLPRFEYTPPELITLLVTDLGIFTPSAVSDELIKLYLE